MDKLENLNIYQKLHRASQSLESIHKIKPKDVNHKVVSSSIAVEPIKKAIDDNRLFLEVQIEALTESIYSQKTKFGDRTMYLTEVHLTYTFVNIDKPEEKIQKNWIGRFSMDAPGTSYGATLTYTEKYFLLKFFNVPTDEDDPDLKPAVVEDLSKKNTPKQPEKVLTNISEPLPEWLVKAFRECKTIDELNTKHESLIGNPKWDKVTKLDSYNDFYNAEAKRFI